MPAGSGAVGAAVAAGTPVSADGLADVLAALAEFATADDLARLDELRDRASARRLRVLVAGEAKRGKSTLVNRLLGADVMPTGVVPVTAVATIVRRDRDQPCEGTGQAFAEFLDGRRERIAVDRVAELVTEKQNPRNEKGVARVEIVLGSGPLDTFDVELVDTPGTGSVFAHNTDAARTAYEGLDAAVFVVTADPPISAAERDLLRDISGRSVRTMVFLNKADQLSADDLAEAVEFTRSVCDQAAEDRLPVFSGSARASDAGYGEFAEAFGDYLAASARQDADRALTGHARRLIDSLLDATRLARRSVELMAEGSRDRVSAFAGRLAEVREQQSERDDRGWAVERRLRRTLDEAAGELGMRLTRRCREAVVAAVDAAPPDASAERLEEEVRGTVATMIETDVDRWRAEQATVLDAGLRELWGRVAAEHEQQVADLRSAARELLDIDLTASTDVQRLADSRGFWYMFERPPAVELPLAATVRRLAPGRIRRVRARLLDEVPQLVDRQVGRARADLQSRLREGMRVLLGDLRRAQDDLVGRLEHALAEADAVDRDTAVTERDRTQALAERADRLHRLLARLDAG